MLPAQSRHSDNPLARYALAGFIPAIQRPPMSTDASETNLILNYSIETFSPFTCDG